jgi:hypothetical protein
MLQAFSNLASLFGGLLRPFFAFFGVGPFLRPFLELHMASPFWGFSVPLLFVVKSVQSSTVPLSQWWEVNHLCWIQKTIECKSSEYRCRPGHYFPSGTSSSGSGFTHFIGWDEHLEILRPKQHDLTRAGGKSFKSRIGVVSDGINYRRSVHITCYGARGSRDSKFVYDVKKWFKGLDLTPPTKSGSSFPRITHVLSPPIFVNDSMGVGSDRRISKLFVHVAWCQPTANWEDQNAFTFLSWGLLNQDSTPLWNVLINIHLPSTS